MSCSGKCPVKSTQLAESYRSRNVSADLEPSEESYTRKLLRPEIVRSFTLLGTARKRRPPLPEILLWTTASRHPSESQTSECSDLLSRSRATFVIVAQRQPGKLNGEKSGLSCLAVFKFFVGKWRMYNFNFIKKKVTVCIFASSRRVLLAKRAALLHSHMSAVRSFSHDYAF